MSRGHSRWFWGIGLAVLALATGMVARRVVGQRNAASRRPEYPVARVHRRNVDEILKAGGRVRAAEDTVITCEVENLYIPMAGSVFSPGSSTSILDVVDEGTRVKEGDLLCRLDASRYVDASQQQQIRVEAARADLHRAERDLEVARLNLREFVEAADPKLEETLREQVQLAEDQHKVVRDKIAWSEQMAAKGYMAPGKLADERINSLRSALDLTNARSALRTRKRFGSMAERRSLEVQVISQETNREYLQKRLEREESQLEKYETQIEHCSIKAPHDGYVIYINNRGRTPIEPGVQVREKQPLFYLPDLKNLQVHAYFNETVLKRVQVGMTAMVAFEALSNRTVEGKVVKIDQMPDFELYLRSGADVKTYVGRIELNSSPDGLRPGMTAEVDVVTGHLADSLVIPSEAVVVESGHEICYVADGSAIERREVEVQPLSGSELVVRDGLHEGESVILIPGQVQTHFTPTAVH